MQEFTYFQAFEYYKDDFENFKKQNKNIFFECSSHTFNEEHIKKIIW